METELGEQLFGHARCTNCKEKDWECWRYCEEGAGRVSGPGSACARCRATRINNPAPEPMQHRINEPAPEPMQQWMNEPAPGLPQHKIGKTTPEPAQHSISEPISLEESTPEPPQQSISDPNSVSELTREPPQQIAREPTPGSPHSINEPAQEPLQQITIEPTPEPPQHDISEAAQEPPQHSVSESNGVNEPTTMISEPARKSPQHSVNEPTHGPPQQSVSESVPKKEGYMVSTPAKPGASRNLFDRAEDAYWKWRDSCQKPHMPKGFKISTGVVFTPALAKPSLNEAVLAILEEYWEDTDPQNPCGEYTRVFFDDDP